MPKEGSTGWSDTWMVSAKAKHPNCTYKWMDWIVSPEVNAAGGGVVRGGAGADQGLRRRPPTRRTAQTYHALDEAYADQIWYWTTPTRSCLDGRGNTCKDYAAWTQAWTEIKG